MPDVAAKWKTYRFDQIAKLINDRVDTPADSGVERYVGLGHLDPDSLRIRRWGDITDVESTKLRFYPGDIIFGKRRVYQRKLAVADFEGICSAHAMVLRARSDVVLPQFLPFLMQSGRFMERALEISVGSLSPTINWKTLAAEEFALPQIEEQARLVKPLMATAGAIVTLQILHEATAALRLSKLLEVGERFSRSTSGELSRVRVGEVLKLVRRPVEPVAHVRYREIGIRSFGRGIFHKDEIYGKEIGNKRVFAVEPGRLILNVVFAWEGAVAMTSDAERGLIASHRFPMFTTKSDNVSLRYLRHFFLTPHGLHLLGNASPGGAGRNRTLGQDRFLKQYIILPPLNIQREVADQLDAIDQMVAASADRVGDAISLHSAALKDLLTSGVQ